MRATMYNPMQHILTANLNPATGDPNAGVIWIVLAALAVSAVLIVVLVVTGRKKK